MAFIVVSLPSSGLVVLSNFFYFFLCASLVEFRKSTGVLAHVVWTNYSVDYCPGTELPLGDIKVLLYSVLETETMSHRRRSQRDLPPDLGASVVSSHDARLALKCTDFTTC